MAEIAVGVIAAEQVVSTGIEAGAAVAIAKPTHPLTVTLSRVATAPADDTSYGFFHNTRHIMALTY